jgi:phosphatidyl-myo-inositol dimannoside synthase
MTPRGGASVPRILVATPNFPPVRGGIELVADRLATLLPNARIRVVAFRSAGSDDFDRGRALEIRRAWGREHSVKGRLWLNAHVMAEAARFRPSAILNLHAVLSLSTSAVRRLANVPVVLYVHADEARIRPKLLRFAVANADATIAVSSHTKELVAAAGADTARLRVIAPGVDLPTHKVPTIAARPAPPTIATVSRLTDTYKGHDVLLRALPLIRARVPDVRWVVVGDGPLRPMLERQADALGVADAVTFTGEVSDAERDAVLDSAHVFALASRLPDGGSGGEGFGIAFMEASAHGLPVVAGDVGGARDAVQAGRTGILVDPISHIQFAEAVSDLLTDMQAAGALAEGGRSRAQSYAWPAIATQVREVLQEVMTR